MKWRKFLYKYGREVDLILVTSAVVLLIMALYVGLMIANLLLGGES